MQFSAPPILLLLWVIPALVLLYLWGARDGLRGRAGTRSDG